MRLPIQINETSTEPLYYQIEVQLRSLIYSGALTEGSMLPSIRELASQLKCSVITIKRVYSDLENEGLVRTKQGTGTYIAKVEASSREEQRLAVVKKLVEEATEAALQVQCSREELEQIIREILDHHYR